LRCTPGHGRNCSITTRVPSRANPTDYYVEELKDALLDLKQATIEENATLAEQYIVEVLVLLGEL
jgi:hypothetical protein